MSKPMKHKAVRAYLKAYGYTPHTLAIDLNVSEGRAKRILNGHGYFSNDDMERLRFMFGFYFDAMLGWVSPGKVREKWANTRDVANQIKADLKYLEKDGGILYTAMQEETDAAKPVDARFDTLYKETGNDVRRDIALREVVAANGR